MVGEVYKYCLILKEILLLIGKSIIGKSNLKMKQKDKFYRLLLFVLIGSVVFYILKGYIDRAEVRKNPDKVVFCWLFISC